LLSPDPDFVPVGSRTGINYRADFLEYKKILILKAGSKSIRDVFAFFNRTVFSAEKSMFKVEAQVRDVGATDAIMQALDIDSDASDEGSDVVITGNGGDGIGEEFEDSDDLENVIFLAPVAGPSNVTHTSNPTHTSSPTHTPNPTHTEAEAEPPMEAPTVPEKPNGRRGQKSVTTAAKGNSRRPKTRSTAK
jgi:hypothetical protein